MLVICHDSTPFGTTFFNYPAKAGDAAEFAAEKAAKGYNVWFCAHLLQPIGRETKRRKEYAATVLALWGDLDGAPVPGGNLEPNAVVESSPGKFHVYYRLAEGIAPQRAETLNKRLAAALGADPSGCDLTQLLRVPGTINYKYEGQPTVTLKYWTNDFIQGADWYDERLPPLEEPPKRERKETSEEPPVELDGYGMRVWRGEDPKVREDTGELDRSGSLLKIGRVLYDAGAARATIVEALAERDETLGWCKYTDRRDSDEQYHKIVDELERKGRRGRMRAGNASKGKSAGSRKTRTDKGDSGHSASNASNASTFVDPADLPGAAYFPVEVLPETFRRFVREASASIGCPPDYVGMAALVAASAAIGDTRRIILKRDWSESAALYAAVVGPPASKKTPATSIALRPVRDRQMKLKAEYERQMEEHRAKLADLGKDDPKPPKPTLKRTYADDTTVERLADILNQNGRGIVVTKDELAAWLGSMNQYKQGRGSDRQFWLSVHTNQPVAVDRKNLEEPVILPRPFVSLIGGIQPQVLSDFGTDREDGLLERFLFGYPEPRRGMWADDEMEEETRLDYARTIGRLYRLKHAQEEDDPFPHRVGMSGEAKALFIEEYNRLHEEMNEPGFPERLMAVWGKLEAYLARLALILAEIRVAETGQPIEMVERGDVNGAATLLAYFKNHSRRVYGGLYGESPSDLLAVDIAAFLVTSKPSRMWEGTATELYEQLPSDHKGERPEDLARAVRKIARLFDWLEFESFGKRVNNKRPFRLRMKCQP